MAVCLVAIHWIPDLATWIYAEFFGETLVINERAFRFKLLVAYAVCGIATTIGLIGLAWAAWHLPAREAYEAARKARMNQDIDIEISERLNENAGERSQGNA